MNFVKGCIENCADTVQLCDNGYLTANPNTGNIGGIGPNYHYHWNTGDTNSTHWVTSSGNYSCIMTSIDGCFTTQDTIYAKIHISPQPPTITDNLGINITSRR